MEILVQLWRQGLARNEWNKFKQLASLLSSKDAFFFMKGKLY